MRYFTVHSVCKQFFKFNVEDYILTFDDALFSQYYYWSLIDKINTKKIIFVPTGAIRLIDSCRNYFTESYSRFSDCFQSLEQWKKYDNRVDYMTLGELKYIINNYDVTIGGHSHNHLSPNKHGWDLFTRVSSMKEDIKNMFDWFKKYLSIRPVDFCFPFNEEDSFLKMLLEQEGVENFYGKERIEIESLCRNA